MFMGYIYIYIALLKKRNLFFTHFNRNNIVSIFNKEITILQFVLDFIICNNIFYVTKSLNFLNDVKLCTALTLDALKSNLNHKIVHHNL
jgi:hypothetical protein